MRAFLRDRWVIGVVVLGFAAGGGAAYAATQSSGNPQQAFLNDVAKRLNVSPQRLTSAIEAAEIDRVNAAVKDGRLTKAQADAIKHAIEAKGPHFLFGGPGALRGAPGVLGRRGAFPRPPGIFFGVMPPFGLARPLAAAASYLGLTEVQVLNELRSGRSLAQIAKTRHKSVTGLERAITTAIKSSLDQAVAAGRISKSQEQQLLQSLSSRLGDLLNRMPPAFQPGRGGPQYPWVRPPGVPPF